MIEQVINRRNMYLAYQQFVWNKIVQLAETGAMQTDLLNILKEQQQNIIVFTLTAI